MLNTDDIRHHTEVGTGYSKDAMMEKAADEINGLRSTMFNLLDILRRWEPDWSSGEDRQKIIQAMYLLGILADPLEAEKLCKCAGDKDDCHGTKPWPE